MLHSIRIRNFALVEELTLEFQPGFNAITGETGAGKSILLGALDLVLGERADRSSIRSGAEQCRVEAVFEVGGLGRSFQQFLEEKGVEPQEDGLLVLKRVVSGSGANRQFINGSPVTLQTLRDTGEWLVDVHGPHDHQSLLRPATQLEMADAFGGLTPLKERFAQTLTQIKQLDSAKAELVGDERTFMQQLDLLRFQINEIKAAKLQGTQEDLLQEEFHRAHNSARLVQLAQSALSWLSDEEHSAANILGAAGKNLQELARLDPAAGQLLQLHDQTSNLLRQLQQDLLDYSERLEIDPVRLQELEERITLLQSLKRKYGPTLESILQFASGAQNKLQVLEQRDEELVRIEQQLAKLQGELLETGADLSRNRKKIIPNLCSATLAELRGLGFAQCRFEIALETASPETGQFGALNPSGLDATEFQFAPNPGEPLLPLRAIASSGELARVMLALKTVLAEQDRVPVLVFDEVDANVGGETAHAVGERMRQIGLRRQVLCVSHLAPVAALANAHFMVEKKLKDGRTISQIHRLEKEGRITELARMLGGKSEAARRHAETLLKGF
jgi:DNA repair protein RecN (Recombination protein N)